MPAPTALIKFTQDGNVGDGQALAGVPTLPVTIENSTSGPGSNIGSWRINLVYVPPGNPTVAIQLPLAENPNNDTPWASINPDPLPGCYRFQLLAYEGVNYGGDWEEDIRNFAVPDPVFGIKLPPYQMIPPKLPLPGTGLPNEKPDELNFGGQIYGWDGFGDEGLLLHFMRKVINGDFGGNPTATEFVDQDDSPVTLEFSKRYVVDNNGSTPANNIDLNLPAGTDADLGKPIWVKTAYTAAYSLGVRGGARLVCGGSDLIHLGALAGGPIGALILTQSEEGLVLRLSKSGSQYYWMFD